MRYELKMYSRILFLAATLLMLWLPAKADTIPSAFSRPVVWRIGAEVSPAWVPGTNGFLEGENSFGKSVRSTFSGALRADFRFHPSTREGRLYKGAYQGIGVDVHTFYANSLLGTPVSVYVYQGAPLARFGRRLWLGYEWQFGAAFGWKHGEKSATEENLAVSTPVTARMGLGLKLHYSLTDQWQVTFGVNANHYSNGNSSLPNAGVNSIGATVGLAYTPHPQKESSAAYGKVESEADRGRWFYDIVAFGAWRRRIVTVGQNAGQQLCPGKFAVAGLQFAPMRQLNRWVAVGAAVDLQWDESAGLAPYWVEGSQDENIKFTRPPFGKQISAGLSAHAELTMPIFSINVGLGRDIFNPKGNKSFYQSLTLKTFVSRSLFLNVGYRLGNFKDPQNLMLGVGVRL